MERELVLTMLYIAFAVGVALKFVEHLPEMIDTIRFYLTRDKQ